MGQMRCKNISFFELGQTKCK